MMEFTGERVVPGQVDADLWAEHISRYALAAAEIERTGSAGRKILDIGCGTGYGTARLSASGAFACGLDVAPDAAAAAQKEYGNANTKYLAASATAIPFANQVFDLITAFEVIEHIENWDALLAEAARVLKTSGVLFVSTPNIEYYTESRGTAGANPYHVHEFEYAEFCAALTRHFPHCGILLQDRTEGFAFHPVAASKTTHTVFDTRFGKPQEANFFIGICSHSPLPPPGDFVFIPRAGNLLRERERHVTAVNLEITEARAQFKALHVAHEEQNLYLKKQNQWALDLDRDLASAREMITGLQRDLDQRTEWALSTKTELDSAREKITELHQLIEERSQWALRLNAELETARAQIAHVQASRWMRLGKKFGLGPQLDAAAGKAD
jgi:SAM-dependent methyltransferase